MDSNAFPEKLGIVNSFTLLDATVETNFNPSAMIRFAEKPLNPVAYTVAPFMERMPKVFAEYSIGIEIPEK